MQRIQQIILNLLSNAIKFTQHGGSVTIECKFISEKEDLHSEKHIPFFQSSNGHGMVQIKVIDSGIGIKEEDQDKLFKLFGFLDSSKEINT
jgi:two-component system, cell cycle sensor histidine kinase PleC